MKSPFKLALVVVVFVLSVLLSISAFQLPSAQPLTAVNEVFSSARAMKHVEKIAVNIHPAGSPELEPIREYLKSELVAMGLEPEIQKGHGENDAEGFLGFVPYSGELVNIYARLEGSGNTDQDILMLAHYDSTLGGPGAADDASGVAVLLETARVLRSQTPLMNDIVFLFVDGEEADLLDSKLFVEDEGVFWNVDLVINFEARGNRGPSILFETSEGNGWVMKEFKKAVPYPVAYSFTSDVYKMVTNVTDFTPFRSAEKSGFNFSNLGAMKPSQSPGYGRNPGSGFRATPGVLLAVPGKAFWEYSA